MLLQMSEQNNQGRGTTDTSYNSDTRPSRTGRQFLLVYQNQWWLFFQHMPPAVIMEVMTCSILTQIVFCVGLYFNAKCVIIVLEVYVNE